MHRQPHSRPLTNIFILIGALLVSAQFRLQLPFGKAFDAGVLSSVGQQLSFFQARGVEVGSYCALRVEFFLIVVSVWLGASLLCAVTRERWFPVSAFLLSLAVTTALLWSIFAELSRLQIAYFVGIALLLKALMIVASQFQRQSRRSFAESVGILWKNKTLLLLWTQYNVRSRYSQSILGIAWAVLLPLATSSVLALAFSNILRASVGSVPFVAFMLTAIVPWNLSNYGIQGSTRSLAGAMNLINQANFPREILVLVTLGEGIADLIFTLVTLVLIVTLSGFPPSGLYIYLPLYFLVQLCLTAGIMFLVSTASVLVRDIPPLVSVGLQLLFFLTPIIYPISSIPEQYRVWLVLNPFSAIIQGYRDIFLRQPPNLSTLYYPAVCGLALVVVGYAYLKANESRLADFV